MGSMRMKDNNDEDLALFREMQKRDKEQEKLLRFQNSDEFYSPAEIMSSSSHLFDLASTAPAPVTVRKTGADDFLNSDNDKSDYEWLITPPGTPLFHSLEMEPQKALTSQLGAPKTLPTSLKSSLAISQLQPSVSSKLSTRQPTSSPLSGLRRPSSSGGPGSRASMTTGRSLTANSQSRATMIASMKPSLTASSKVTATASSKVTTTSSKLSRSTTPSSRPTLTSAKPTAPPRSSTPTARSTIRSSTPTSRPSVPASKPMPRAATPTRRPTTVSTAMSISDVSLNSSTSSSSVSKLVSDAQKNSGSLRPSSPTMRPRPWKPSDMPGFSLDAPPNLRTSLSDRPPSVTRGRPGAPSSRAASIEPVSNGRIRRQSCSPSRGRPPNGTVHNSGSSVPVSAINRLRAKANDNVSPVLMGTKMVERVINMRKLNPPNQDKKHSPHRNLSGNVASPDSSGFGRSLSKKSLDMAMRHMDIRRTIPGNLRALTSNKPASSMYSVRCEPNNGKTLSASGSPLAGGSNASSEMSVNNNALCMDGSEVDDGACSRKGAQYSANSLGR